jgi:predicted short-subunit dehydrogenase-like oxidoreductase (DUF2520 family)
MIIAGPGRAGGALAIAAAAAGHHIVGVVSRSGAMAGRFPSLSYEDELPAAEILVIATPDDQIGPTAERLLPIVSRVDSVIHLSGFTSVRVLGQFAEAGAHIGSFHPLQSFPDPEVGAKSLAGSWVGLTASEPLLGRLTELAATLSMIPFPLPDESKALYHASATAASNFVVAALDLADKLAKQTSVPFEAFQPLTTTAIANAFASGPAQTLTGPIARGDWETVRGQFEAVADSVPDRLQQFQAMVQATAITADRTFPDDLDV